MKTQKNQTKQPNKPSKLAGQKKFFIPELIFIILAGICLLFSALTCYEAHQMLTTGKAAGIIAGALTVLFFSLISFVGMGFSLINIIISAIGYVKTGKKSLQLVFLIVSIVVILIFVTLFLITRFA